MVGRRDPSPPSVPGNGSLLGWDDRDFREERDRDGRDFRENRDGVACRGLGYQGF